MNTERLNDKAQLFGSAFLHNYARSRKIAARLFAVLCVFFLAAAHVLTYFLAQAAGHSWNNAVILTAVPFVGPAAFCLQLLLAGEMSSLYPAYLLGALLPAVAFLLLGAHFHDLSRRALCVLAEREEAAAALAEKQAARERQAAAASPVILRPGTSGAPAAGGIPLSAAMAAPSPSAAPKEPAMAAAPAGAKPVPAASPAMHGTPGGDKAETNAAPPEKAAQRQPVSSVPSRPAAVPKSPASPAGSAPAKAEAAAVSAVARPVPADAAKPAADAGMKAAPAASSAPIPAAGARPSQSAGTAAPGKIEKGEEAGEEPSAMRKVEEEYARAMQDVLAFLHKK